MCSCMFAIKMIIAPVSHFLYFVVFSRCIFCIFHIFIYFAKSHNCDDVPTLRVGGRDSFSWVARDCIFIVLFKMLLPYSRSSRIDETNPDGFPARVFLISDSQSSVIKTNGISESWFERLSWLNLSDSVAPESRMMVLGGPWHCH